MQEARARGVHEVQFIYAHRGLMQHRGVCFVCPSHWPSGRESFFYLAKKFCVAHPEDNCN